MSDQPTDRDRLAALLDDHQFVLTGQSDQPMCCSCQQGCCNENGHMLTMTPDEHPAHVADALIAAGVTMPGPTCGATAVIDGIQYACDQPKHRDNQWTHSCTDNVGTIRWLDGPHKPVLPVSPHFVGLVVTAGDHPMSDQPTDRDR